jgi:hypothetical protein
MVCDPASNNLNPVSLGPPPNIIPFGFPFTFGIPLDVKIPEGIPEDFLELVRRLVALIPGGKLLANTTNFSKDIMDILASLLNQLGPYLALYNFFQALLNMIMCILDVLCSLMNPFALIRAINRLFKNCLPDFLNLFPWLALIAMIIALLLLLLALLDYLLSQILAIIRDIIENLLVLAKSLQVHATDSDILAAARKIASLLCILEQLFAILIAFQAIMAIIESLAKIGGRSVCGSGSTIIGDDPGCCSDEFCPPFISQNPDGLTGIEGDLIYYSQVNNSPTGLPAGLVLPPARNESWQFANLDLQTYNIKDIITPIVDNTIYWPEGQSFTFDSNTKKVPYLLDMRMIVDPTVFGHTDIGTTREFFITGCVVTKKPYIGFFDFVGNLNPFVKTGTVEIAGGLVFEADGVTPVLINGQQAILNNFIHEPTKIGYPTSNDAVAIKSIRYTLKINHPALLEANVITLGCVPSVAAEREVANIVSQLSVPQLTAVISRVSLPNIGGTVDCMTTALAKFRANVSPDNALVFQADMTACINNLKGQTQNAYKAAVAGGVSPFKTVLTIDPDLQFVSLPIKVSVTLKDPSGTIISQNIPAALQGDIAVLLTGNASFGHLSPFVYDGYQDFVANITATAPGSGELFVSFENNVISKITGQNNINVTTSIGPDVKPYRFIGRPIFGSGEEADPIPRRDEGDTARSDE